MDKFPLQLSNFFFVKTVIESIPDFSIDNKGSGEVLPTNQIDVRKVENNEAGDTNFYSFTMRTTFNLDKTIDFPYMIDMECVVLFKVDKEETEEEAKKGVTITGHSVAYGAIREAVSWMTGRHPYGHIQLGLSVLKPQEAEKEKKEAER